MPFPCFFLCPSPQEAELEGVIVKERGGHRKQGNKKTMKKEEKYRENERHG